MRFAVLCILSAVLLSTGAWATTHHVPGEYATIQAGVDAASVGDTVLVAPGIYSDFEVRSGQFGPVSACVFVKDGVVLKSEGGATVTTIDRNWADTPEPAFTIHGYDLSSSESVIEGFRITRNPPPAGAVRIQWSLGLTIVRDCLFEELPAGGSTVDYASVQFEGCTFVTGGGRGVLGNGASLTVENCIFDGNSPGIKCDGDDIVPPQHLTVRNSTLRNNTANEGAAIVVADYFNGVLIEDCVFENNSSRSGGAILALGVGSRVIQHNLFVNNRAEGSAFARGGAMQVSGAVTIRGNTIVDSYQEGPSGGAAINVTGPSSGSSIASNIIAGSTGDIAVRVAFGTLDTSCNVFWNNVEGDIVGVPLDPTDVIADPLFCDPPSGDYTVSSASPCLPENNPNCVELIGAYGLGCGFISVEPMSWGRLKGFYRTGE